MRIRKVNLNNFRQFHGEQEIEFSCDPVKNVTLVHAENTYGKTTLLNAVYWALFENTTAKFENPKDIVSWAALNNGDNKSIVSVEFSDKDNSFIATRAFDQSSKKSSLLVSKIINGNYEPVRNPADFVDLIIPGEMAKYFFFDGEAAEAFSSVKNYKAVGDVIRAILGCSLADRAINDLNEIRKDLNKEIGDKANDEEIVKLSEYIEAAEKFIEDELDTIEKIRETISEKDRIKSRLVSELRDYKAVKEIQEEREKKEKARDAVEQKIESTSSKLINWISRSGTSLIGRRLANEAKHYINDKETQKKIPSPYNEDLVNSILKDKICICGREITPGSKEWQTIADLLKNAATSSLINKLSRAKSRINSIVEVGREAHDIFIEYQKELGQLKQQHSALEEDITSLGKRIENCNFSEIEEKEKARRRAESAIHDLIKQIGRHEADIKRARNEITSSERTLKTLTRKNELANKLQSRRDLVVQAKEQLATILEAYEIEARTSIEKEINEILSHVAHNHRICRFNQNFSIELTKYDGTPAPKSSGENQLLSLVFMASLIKHATSRLDDDNFILKPGTVAPLVLDSPFGQLDKIYQTEMATYLPNLAPQLVLFLSSTQGNEKVLEALAPYIGAEYVLVSHSEDEQGSKKITELTRHGHTIPTKLFSQKDEMTEIVRIS